MAARLVNPNRRRARAVACSFVGILLPAMALGQSPTWTTQDAVLEVIPAPILGTLLVPTNTVRRVPLVVIIAGSGPTDRDGSSPMARPDNLRQLAESLAARGIASVRYDKRGIAGSRAAGTSEAELRFDTYADDAAGWVKKYRSDPRFGAIVIVGHSEGSLLGMLASQRSPVDAFVSVAGTARHADKVLHDQLAAQLPPALLATADSVLAALVAGRTVDNSPPMLAAIFRPSVQAYIISWFKYSGSQEIAKLRVPVLIAQGTHDIQVAPAEADSLARALPTARLAMIEGMNHVMKRTPAPRAEQMASYITPDMPVMSELVEAIVGFIKGLKQ